MTDDIVKLDPFERKIIRSVLDVCSTTEAVIEQLRIDARANPRWSDTLGVIAGKIKSLDIATLISVCETVDR